MCTLSDAYNTTRFSQEGLASGLKECKGNERTVPNEEKSPKIGRIRAMYREKEAPP